MFFEKLKHQFKWYFLVALGFWLVRSWLGREIPMNVLGFSTMLVFRFFITALTAFVFYTGVYCFDTLWNWSRGKLSKISTLLL
ncbi:hypothetical protein F4X90_06345 [Candidatus Poribacteria bacterium]|nr:hypothetical protein [Candidatus Poribacteria bacterium]